MMEPAFTIIERLGGTVAVSRAVGIHRSRVWKWTQPKAKGGGGTDGAIPLRHVRSLIRFGATIGVSLAAEDFLPFEPGATHRPAQSSQPRLSSDRNVSIDNIATKSKENLGVSDGEVGNA